MLMKISAKDIASLVRTLSKTANKPHFTSAIIVAAGKGTRMQDESGKTKQHLEICGIPVIVRTLTAFEKCDMIDEIIIVARKEEMSEYDRYKREYGLTKITAVVNGGDTRQESVLRGFEAINDKSEFVAIHDGARCLIRGVDIEAVLRAAYQYGAATAASRATDTVKRADRNSFITETIERENLWLASTPQIFKTEVYRAAAYVAKEDGFTTTDDNALAERVGFSVKLVDVGSENIKITTKSDIPVAEAIINRRAK